VVTVVPLSHILESRAETDLIIGKDENNKLEHDSRLLFGDMQPVLKSDFASIDDNVWSAAGLQEG
jgi:hypothetical protein